ncbi:hypothetical protein U732_1118 [Clostridium argentinense CDC 2741]|uniref:Uncharacterized protein n=1 Tax=Clostridium argentinense CDC 2741 TaxID=1418104 RepID=A0A0C1R1P2_9CLOT|nr:hypothetical protein [Clostridium argentinense]ARC85646.1 hypothetical protein RSJ17_14595 [Clostridium argentinense]KIE47352.1 hypothetical protein U732_1118 [Clostridium argentinense CDC 2741]NFF40831.1 hypothetical protein [Clostridium argentinense]NFP50763.1 hypothetical protein [Clostridium argentinense]NFP73080.1 hypothetical protein [Clostridium argentinense]
MKEYTDGKRQIYATDKAYKVIYKGQGFKEVKKKLEKEVVENADDTESNDSTTIRRGRKSK